MQTVSLGDKKKKKKIAWSVKILLEYRIWHFMQIVPLGDNLHEMSDPIF